MGRYVCIMQFLFSVFRRRCKVKVPQYRMWTGEELLLWGGLGGNYNMVVFMTFLG